MVKEIITPKEGYEKVVAVFDELIANIEEAKAEEIAAIELKYAERLNTYNKDREAYVSVELVEIPDEEDELMSETTDETNNEIGDLGNPNEEFQSI